MNRQKPHRGTIFVEEAEILGHDGHPGDQFVLRLKAPQCAAAARPGSFVHIQCDPLLPMRRPISIMQTDTCAGTIDLLYKRLGNGTHLLSTRKVGERLNLMGPIGQPFTPRGDRPRALLIGGGVGIPPMVFLAAALKDHPAYRPLVLMGSEVPFPFRPQPSQILVPGLPAAVTAAMPLLDDWGVPSRLASRSGFAGCFDGFVTDLARCWLEALDADARREVMIFTCGPHPMLEAVANLAQEFHLPCQVSLEEFMACGVGGCAGCAVEIATPDGPAMKRVCVDGPVFDARAVFGA